MAFSTVFLNSSPILSADSMPGESTERGSIITNCFYDIFLKRSFGTVASYRIRRPLGPHFFDGGWFRLSKFRQASRGIWVSPRVRVGPTRLTGVRTRVQQAGASRLPRYLNESRQLNHRSNGTDLSTPDGAGLLNRVRRCFRADPTVVSCIQRNPLL